MTVIEDANRSRNSTARIPFTLMGGSLAQTRLFLLALAGLSALYLLQTLSPLRLDSDAVDYLTTGAAIADGRALPKVPFPLGFPTIISLLDRAGLGASFFFILLNCIFIALGLWASWRIFADESVQVRMWIVVATLLAISVVKSVAAPLPEAAFFGTSLLALAAASAALSARGVRQALLFAAAFAVAAMAISIRLVGSALVPTLFVACLWAIHHARSGQVNKIPVGTILIALAIAAVALIVVKMPSFISYIEHPRYWYLYGGLSSPVVGRIYGLLASLGQSVINVPLSRFHSLAPVFAGAGLVAIGALVIARPRPNKVKLADFYLFFYLGILAFWPYDSPRLWMPIVPLIAAHIASPIERYRDNRAVRLLATAYAAWFAFTGVLALAYTTRISLSGDDFARIYGKNGGMATAIVQTLGPAEKQKYNARADSMLDRYGSRAARVR